MRLFFNEKRIKAEKEKGNNDDSLYGGTACRLSDIDLAEESSAGSATVIVEPAEVGDVEIFGEYVGRIRAQQVCRSSCARRGIPGEYAFRRR